jgi:cytochrome c
MQRVHRTTTLVAVAAMICLAATVMAKSAVAKPGLQETMGSADGVFGFGRPATKEEIAAWDIDVRADGAGLPEGSGTVAEGGALYAEHCAKCHGDTGRDSPYLPFRALVREYDPATWPEWPLTIGNYWPYATTVFDFTRRAMPFDTPGILSDAEVYAITAWLLNQNGTIPDDAVMDAKSLPQIKMPAFQHYVPLDPRDAYPYQ